MSIRNPKPIIIVTIIFLLSAALLYWYSLGSKPLSKAEVNEYMATISAHESVFRTEEDLKAFQVFLEKDDGQPFYTINLYKFRETALYEDKQPPFLSGAKAFEKFTSIMIPLLAKQASHPIFGTNWLHNQTDRWDRLVIVRYRSRRDIAEIFTTSAFAVASKHKWAALEDNERFVAQALHIPALYFPVALLMTIISIIVGRTSQNAKRGSRQ